MPHFIIDCSKQILEQKSPEDIMQKVYDAAKSTRLFLPEEIKVRINSFEYYNTGNTKDNFIHVFGNIMQGRSEGQKANLSKIIITKLKSIFPEIPIISMNIRDFEKATYFNKEMI
ncbi:5-carboxymethyl-2-hydroxymuconate Delta-isomerase [Aestuariibaculum sp. YM273]|uniref:5-carboxymethyl-2-hydroxymuconate Delta-isomerase n=1 Tax=Aestuariibaculum sp. YM273 TaxID=3070659 RepID=UPI0027DC88F2|nr:5-carboxymethyl-2-hydroxymuconate Delta-isomerase [Aestuariibaculum sp. YM273]WMI64776.1 5-carboxymethyl-2-hydroxymuconate Delta-isomerase [Aestuariibaculum sp. YM273]